MIKPFRPHPQDLQPLQAGPLAAHLVSFAALLAQQRYSRVNGWNKLQLVAALSCWMNHEKLQLGDLNERCVSKFLEWRWRHYVYHSGDKCTPALLLQHLHQLDVIPPPTPVPLTPIDVMERAYGQWWKCIVSAVSDLTVASRAGADRLCGRNRRFVYEVSITNNCSNDLMSHAVDLSVKAGSGSDKF